MRQALRKVYTVAKPLLPLVALGAILVATLADYTTAHQWPNTPGR